MTYYIKEVPSQEATIIRPIIKSVLAAIANTWFSDCPDQLHYIDHTGQRHIAGTRKGEDEHHVNLDNDSRLEATVTMRNNTDKAFIQEYTPDNAVPCWSDANVNAHLRLKRFTRTVEIRIRSISSSKGEADRWLNQYQHRVVAGALQLHESAHYEVIVPDAFPYIIKEIHRVRESNAGYGDTFEDYLDSHFLVPHAIRYNQAGQHKTLVLREVLRNIGIAVPVEIPEITRTDSGGWEAELTLEFDLDVPSILHLEYSPFIHNRLMSSTFYDNTFNRNAVSRTSFSYGSPHGRLLGAMNDTMGPNVYRTTPYVYPPFDTEVINVKSAKIIPFLQTRILIDESNLRLNLDLTTLATDIGIELHPELIPFIISERGSITKRLLGIFTVLVCGSGTPLTSDRYSVTTEGLLVADYDMNLREEYHVVIGIRDDLPFANESIIKPLLSKGKLLLALLRYCYPELKENQLPKLRSDNSVTMSEMLKVGKFIPTRMKPLSSRVYLSSALITEKK